jgi:hypothetical protein
MLVKERIRKKRNVPDKPIGPYLLYPALCPSLACVVVAENAQTSRYDSFVVWCGCGTTVTHEHERVNSFVV